MKKKVMVDLSATIIHHGHVRLLKKASRYGNVIVGLTADKEIIKHKKYKPELKYEFRKEILNELKWAFAKKNQKLNKKIFFYKHHLSHAASTFYSSGYKESSILVLDGMGEEFTGGFYVGKKNKITCIKKFNLPNTLGGFYSTFTEFFGFKSNSEEGKLMALASFGNYSEKIQKKLNKFMKKKISIVMPFFNEEKNLLNIFNDLKKKVIDVNQQIYDFEVLLMNNNSIDNSSNIAKEIKNKFNYVKYYKMSRNFGYQANIKAGYDLCTGDAAVQLDTDGEDDPELINKFIKKWEEGHEVVYGVRTKRQENKILSLTRNIFYFFIRKYSSFYIPEKAGDFRLIDRKVLNYLKKFGIPIATSFL